MELNNNMLENLLEGAYILNANRIITYWNKAAEKITGYLGEEVIGKGCKDNILVHIDENGESLCKNRCPASKSLNDSKIAEANVYLHHKEGHRVYVTVRVIPIKDNQGQVMGMIEFFVPNNSNLINKEKINELVKLSFLDVVTNLVNRRYIELKMNSIFSEKQNTKLSYSVVIFHIKNFKTINKEYGDLISDKVAKMVTHTLTDNLKYQAIIGRWSDDRYIVLLSEIKKGICLIQANKLKVLLENSFIINENKKINLECYVVGTNLRASDSYDVIMNRIEKLFSDAKSDEKDKFDFD